MANQREAGRPPRTSSGILGLDLHDREERGPNAADARLERTEEHGLTEAERLQAVNDIGNVPLVGARSAVVLVEQPDPDERSTGDAPSGLTPPATELARPAPSPGAPRALWIATVVLAFTLAGAVTYGYLALRQNSLIVSQLPGAAAVRAMRAEAAVARFRLQEFEQSRFSREMIALGHKTRPALAVASKRVQQLAGRVHDRYVRWRADR